MGTLMDYLDWRGDLSFSAVPLNSVDNYIISKIGKLDYTDVAPSDEREMPIAEAINRYVILYGEKGEYLGMLASKSIWPMIQKLPETKRFSELTLSGFVSDISEDACKQFSAITIGLPDGSHYVSFAGTDDTLVAWREDFMLSLEHQVPAQLDALKYLEWAAAHYDGPLIVGGHSKGGNLAVFAAAKVNPEIQNRIKAVYSNDGPGFSAEFFASPEYQRIKGRVHKIVPKESIVGTLLTQEENLEIVDCRRSGISAHDGFTWEVMGGDFVHVPELTKSSQAFDESLNRIMADMSMEQRKQLINELFDALMSTGAKTVTELTKKNLFQTLTVFGSLSQDSRTKEFVLNVMSNMFAELTPIKAFKK